MRIKCDDVSNAKFSACYIYATTQLMRVIFPVLPLTSSVSLSKSVYLLLHHFPFYKMGVVKVSYKNTVIIKSGDTCNALRTNA